MYNTQPLYASDNPLVPAQAPIHMPEQSFSQCGTAHSHAPREAGTLLARLAVAVLTTGVTGYALYEILAIVGFGNAAGMQFVLVGLFVLTFFWMALGAAAAVLGFMRLVFLRSPEDDGPWPAQAGGRTAIVMPVYNEDPEKTLSALSRMGDSIAAEPWRRRVEIFILSDSTDPSIGMSELHAAGILSQRLAGRIPVYYRRRNDNSGRKAGNITDFLRRWGGRYAYMIVLDADSYLTSESIGRLIAAMDHDPRAGLIQAAIRLAGQDSLFARMQQFSAAVYGRIANAGSALWHGRDGNFNGHNAIVRVSAFAASCGLPELSRARPFGGHILSHDFVEAALLRRAGWDVYTRIDINGTYEESPPNLIEYFKRDRRWMQGNIQHSRILPAAGLHWMSRMHMTTGIMAYLSSVLWLLFLVVGAGIAVYTTMFPRSYFPEAHSLFPTWPVFDSERAYLLTGFVMVVVLLPKFLGYTAALVDRATRTAAGGILPLTFGAILEIVAAALLAPLHMVVQVTHLTEILLGKDSGWPAQDRNGSTIHFSRALRYFAVPTMAGAAMAVGSWSLSFSLFAWLAPIWLGLVLAIPMAMMTSSRVAGLRTRAAGLFLIEEEGRFPGASGFDGTHASHPSDIIPLRSR